MKTYIIHRGNKNEKVKGKFRIVEDKVLGQRWLVGDKLLKILHWRGGVDEVYTPVRIDITNCNLTIKG